MGEKKRKPLRSHQIQDSATERKTKNLKIDGSAANIARQTKSTKMAKREKFSKDMTPDTESDEWEKIEQQQSNLTEPKSGRCGKDESDSDDDDGDEDEEDDEIKLEGSIEHITEKYTFEFNDMREEYTEGICVLLRSLMQNPTKAYELAKTITSQSMSSFTCFYSHCFLVFSISRLLLCYFCS